MTKPFKSIDEQVELLNVRGVQTDNMTGIILLREGYYPVVNGYKEPFINLAETRAVGDDRFIEGTKFDDIYTLFLFDRALRETTFHFTIEMEALFRNACIYSFANIHRGIEDYLMAENYVDKTDYIARGLKDYDKDLFELQKVLRHKAKHSGRSSIKHHRETYGRVPLWVLGTDLTFGNMEHFFNLMKEGERNAVCRSIVEATGQKGGKQGYLAPKQVSSDINTIVKVRNMCAHDERLYCARIGRRKNVDFSGFMMCSRRYMSESEFERFKKDILSIIKMFSDKSEMVFHITAKMGLAANLA